MDVRVIICLIFVVLMSLPETSENERLMQDGSDELSDDDDDDDYNNEILRHDPRPFGRRRIFRKFSLRKLIRTCFRKKTEAKCRLIRSFNRWIYICPSTPVRRCS